jgi:multiple sugar transport system permease protein
VAADCDQFRAYAHLATLKGSFRDTTDWTVLMAAATLSILPVVVVFLFGQKQFMKGIMAGGLKE